MRVVLWCNGVLPDASTVDRALAGEVLIYGVDGGADKAESMGFEVSEALGDMDSIDVSSWTGKMKVLPNQDRSDLSKALEYVNSIGIMEVDIIGVEGGDYGHVFGSMASLTEAPDGMKIRIHFESGVLYFSSPSNGGFEMHILVGQKFSVFALTPSMSTSVTGGKWTLDNEALSFSTRGLSNEGMGSLVTVSSDAPMAIFVNDSI
ncbi:MAG: thiamine diphosphokinase [Euryarchaeota archaeon]|jgi:thiamine pyrophosphokinase|nr:thiamine diphosphokinase [Euryarchaeota archaeon]|tara:strand:+ start:1095 stop:1709 length:615 start_codon:yes stop_codon:yes gene_type:complete